MTVPKETPFSRIKCLIPSPESTLWLTAPQIAVAYFSICTLYKSQVAGLGSNLKLCRA
jgi:hypothetical protein